MGTPDFAVKPLEAIIESGENVMAVFTQPDKPKGRGFKLLPTPVKQSALSHNIPVYQPLSLKKGDDAAEAEKIMRELAPDLIVVAAYGKILPKTILDLPKYGCINIHASLLPKYRGAAPIQRVILNGETETGVTAMQMAEGLDTGDMLMKISTPIGENETASELFERLSDLGAKLIVDTIKAVKSGSITPVKQDDSLSSYAEMIDKSMCFTDFSLTAAEVHNHIRGLSSSPCAVAYLNGKRIKIYHSELVKNVGGQPGEIVNVNDFTVSCGDGNGVKLAEIQGEGGKRMKAADFLRGNKIEKGTFLKSSPEI